MGPSKVFNENYVLMTAAKNEEGFIEKTIEGVINQTCLPRKWVIISDGSTDNTDSIVDRFQRKYDFIELIRFQGDKNRSFSSKARVLKVGYERLKDLHYEYIGNLDADISLGADYFERILNKFKEDNVLGIGGGIIYEYRKGRLAKLNISLNSVSGAVQLFRRECYDMVGGYIPTPYGGVDSAAEILARMHKWNVKTFPDITAIHNRPIGTANHSLYKASFRRGLTFYTLGYHPLFELFRCLSRLFDRPYLIGSFLEFTGYSWASITKNKFIFSNEVVAYLRKTQLKRLKNVLAGSNNA